VSYFLLFSLSACRTDPITTPWYELGNFAWNDSGLITTEEGIWQGSGTASPLENMNGSLQLQQPDCTLTITITESIPIACSECHFAFELQYFPEEEGDCSGFPSDQDFANQEKITLGFWGMDVLYLSGDSWITIQDAQFEHNLDDGSYELQFPSWNE